MYLLFALAYLCVDWHIPPQIPASIINNTSTSVNNSKFTFVFLSTLAMLIRVQIGNEKDQVHIFQYTRL